MHMSLGCGKNRLGEHMQNSMRKDAIGDGHTNPGPYFFFLSSMQEKSIEVHGQIH